MKNTDMSALKMDGTPTAAHGRVRHIRATASLADDIPWVVVAATPVDPGAPASGWEPGPLIEFVRGEIASWPAPIPLASESPLLLDDRIVFAPAGNPATVGALYRAEFYPDGSAVVAIAVGSRQTQPSGTNPVWAIGEGAFVWIVIAALRLAAAYADRVMDIEELCVDATITSPHDREVAPLEIWNRDRRGYGPTGHRCTEVEPVSQRMASSDCLSAGLVGIAHPLIAGVLHQFDLSGDRHVDASGMLRRARFTGFEDNILAWADAIGVASQP